MTTPNIDTEALREKYVESLAKLPPWKCGRIDINTFLPEPVQVGRVCSDVIRYVYFDDGKEVVVIGGRADEIAFAASEYRALLATVEAQRKECASNLRLLHNAQEEAYALYEERDALKAEVERLTAERLNLIGESGAASTRANRLKAEVERLRAALGEMLGIVRCDPTMDGSERPRGLHHNAAEVLARVRPIYFERAALRGEEASRA